jgi:hypothetical protein
VIQEGSFLPFKGRREGSYTPQLVTPNVVAMAVSTDVIRLIINFQVSLFID